MRALLAALLALGLGIPSATSAWPRHTSSGASYRYRGQQLELFLGVALTPEHGERNAPEPGLDEPELRAPRHEREDPPRSGGEGGLPDAATRAHRPGRREGRVRATRSTTLSL